MVYGRDPERPDPAEPSRQRIRETMVERQIQTAMEEGAFDDLPHQGRRLPLDDDAAAGDRAIAHRMLKNAGVAPAWIEADKTVRVLLAERDRLVASAAGASASELARAKVRLTRLVDDANRAILRVDIEAPTDRQHRRPLDVEVELARLERTAREGRPPSS
jgi:Domain of unknown function (DUF1992)